MSSLRRTEEPFQVSIRNLDTSSLPTSDGLLVCCELRGKPFLPFDTFLYRHERMA